MDVDKIKAIVAALEGTTITRFVWRNGEERLLLEMGHAPVVASMPAPMAAPVLREFGAAPAAAPADRGEPAPVANGYVVTSPFVGTFYRASSPESPAFVELGQTVRKGQTLCIVEAMKLMNEIESEVSGRVAEVLVENGQSVEFGQSLFRIEPA